MILPARLARRDLRGGVRGLRIFLFCLALGVAAISGAGLLATGMRTGIEAEAQRLLGGDLSLAVSQREITAEQKAELQAFGTVSHAVEMRAMARAENSQRTLVEVKAADDLYPLFGAVESEPPQPLAAALAAKNGVYGAIADANLLARLGIAIGDRLEVGDAKIIVRGTIVREPDRVASVLVLGPRLLISDKALVATNLVQPGSLTRHLYRLKLAEGKTVGHVTESLKTRFPDAGWRLTLPEEVTPGLKRFLDNITMFLTLVGLTSLLTGGVGIANAVSAHLESRMKTIAILKGIGASGQLVFQTYFLEVAIIAGVGIFLGLLLGSFVPPIGRHLLAGQFPVEAQLGLYPLPLLTAIAFGLLIVLAFALYPLIRARSFPPSLLFREHLNSESRIGWRDWSLIGASVTALIALTVFSAADRNLALWFVGVSSVVVAILSGTSRLIVRLARAATRRMAGIAGSPRLRLALAALHRPGNSTSGVMLSLGIGLSVLLTLALIERNLDRQIAERLPEEAPSFFFIDIQPGQKDEFLNTLEQSGAKNIRHAAMVRARLVRIAGIPAEDARIAPGVQWAIAGDRALTSSIAPPADAKIVAGNWWPADYSGPPLISMDAKVAQGMRLKLGDKLVFNVLGREIEGTIASLREINWMTLNMSFAFIFSPGVLEAAPHSILASAHSGKESEEKIERAVTDRLANISVIRVRQALETVHDMLASTAVAIRLAGAVTLIVGLAVLAGAVAAGRERRAKEAILLKVLGAERADILRLGLIELGILGITAGIIAALVGNLGSWLVLKLLMRSDWVFMPLTTMTITCLGIIIALAAGLFGAWKALGSSAAVQLRND
jgi:putative ABC transport system permease protein